MIERPCIECGKVVRIRKAREKTFKFCSYSCRGAWRSKHWTGAAHPNWQGEKGYKPCQWCGKMFTHRIPITFKRMKFCSKPCADKGGFRYSGEQHPNYRKNARRDNRDWRHNKWANAVVTRDKGKCQKCGISNTEMHAHHIKSYKEHPELRLDIDNGITLCWRCHYNLHAVENENGVKTGEILTGNAEDNPVPSLGGNIREGVTTRGRAFRRWEGHCSECGAYISRRWSDVKGKMAIFCDRACRGKWTRKNMTGKPRDLPFRQ